jgi:hypothetical protein
MEHLSHSDESHCGSFLAQTNFHETLRKARGLIGSADCFSSRPDYVIFITNIDLIFLLSSFKMISQGLKMPSQQQNREAILCGNVF